MIFGWDMILPHQVRFRQVNPLLARLKTEKDLGIMVEWKILSEVIGCRDDRECEQVRRSEWDEVFQMIIRVWIVDDLCGN